MRKEKKGWAGWIAESEEEKLKFQRQALCPGVSRAWVTDDRDGGLDSPQERSGGQGNNDGDQEQEQVPGSGGDAEDGDGGGKMQECYLEERTQEQTQERQTRIRCQSRLSRGKIVRRPVVKKLWVAGRASEDREELMEEVMAPCER